MSTQVHRYQNRVAIAALDLSMAAAAGVMATPFFLIALAPFLPGL